MELFKLIIILLLSILAKSVLFIPRFLSVIFKMFTQINNFICDLIEYEAVLKFKKQEFIWQVHKENE